MKKLLISLICSLSLLATPASVLAATGNGTASLHVTPSSGSYNKNSTIQLTVTESSSVPVASVEADFSYPAAQLDCLGVNTSTSAFATTYQNTCSGGTISIARGVQGTTISGSHIVAVISFKVLSGSGNGSITVADTSEIDDASVNNACDASCAGGNVIATYAFTTPTPTKPKAPAPTHTSTTTTATSTPVVTTTDTTTTKKTAAKTDPGVLGETNANPAANTASVQESKSQPVALWSLGTVLLAIAVYFAYRFSRPAPAVARDTRKKTAPSKQAKRKTTRR